MSRLSLVRSHAASAPVRALFDRFTRERGSVPNMLRAMAHRPEIAETAFQHMDAVYKSGTVARSLKELLTVRVSQINRCDY